jgi:hypothetical protein
MPSLDLTGIYYVDYVFIEKFHEGAKVYLLMA